MAPTVLAAIVSFTPGTTTAKTMPVSLKNVLDGAVKMINFVVFDFWVYRYFFSPKKVEKTFFH